MDIREKYGLTVCRELTAELSRGLVSLVASHEAPFEIRGKRLSKEEIEVIKKAAEIVDTLTDSYDEALRGETKYNDNNLPDIVIK